MSDENVCVTLDNFEQRLLVNGMSDFRNRLIREDIPTEDVDDVLIKIIEAPKTKKAKDRGAR